MSWLDRFRTRKSAYLRLFLAGDGRVGPDALIVLADLKRFCNVERPILRVSKVSGNVDPYASFMAEGRREVWLRIQAHLRLDDAKISQLREESDEL